MGERLISLIYVSSATEEVDETQLLDIMAVSRANNQRDRITGMLLYKGGNFMQVLEGPEDSVLARYDKIRKDPRHKDVYLISVQPTREREFPRWEMGFKDIERLDIKSLPGYTPFLEEELDSDVFLEEPTRAKIMLTTFKEGMG
jgi:hypothetical protein